MRHLVVRAGPGPMTTGEFVNRAQMMNSDLCLLPLTLSLGACWSCGTPGAFWSEGGYSLVWAVRCVCVWHAQVSQVSLC